MKRIIMGMLCLPMIFISSMHASVHKVRSDHDFLETASSKQLVMVHFCQKGKEHRKAFVQVAEKFPEVYCMEVKADRPEMSKLVQANGIAKLPACILMRDGRHIDEVLYLDVSAIDSEQTALRLMSDFLFKYFRAELESQRRAREEEARREEEANGVGGISVVPVVYDSGYYEPDYYYDYYPYPDYVTYGVYRGGRGGHFRGGGHSSGGGHVSGSHSHTSGSHSSGSGRHH